MMLARSLRRGGVRAALPRPPRLHRALHPRRDRQAAQGHVALRGSPRRRRHRPAARSASRRRSRSASDSMMIDFTGIVAAGARRDQLRLSVHAARRRSPACARSSTSSIPNNAGYFRPIEVIAPEGTVVNPRMPAAVAARGITGIRIGDAIFGALAQAVPHVLPACGSNAPDVGISFGGDRRATASRIVYLEFLLALLGRRPRPRRHGCVHGHARELFERAGRDDRGRPADRGRALRAGAGHAAGPGASAAAWRSSGTCASASIAARCRSAPTAATIRPTGCEGGKPGAPSNVDIRARRRQARGLRRRSS